MSTGEILLEILKYVGPAGLVLGAAALFLREQRARQEAQDRNKVLRDTFAHIVPLRLQAYERLIIYLERISPDVLVLRSDGQGKTARLFQQQLVTEIRDEFAHNIAQQLYLKHETWMEVVRAKEQMIALINQSGRQLPPEATGIDLGKKILNEMIRSEQSPTFPAIISLKQDVQGMFRI